MRLKRGFNQVRTMSGSRYMGFFRFAQICSIILQKGPKITQPINIFFGNNLNYLEDNLGNLEPQLEFYHREGVGGPPLGPGL